MGRWTLTDTLGDYLDGESRREQRLDEEARDLRWQAFMDWARARDRRYVCFICSMHLDKSASQIRALYCQEYELLADFLEEHNWSGVLYALAQVQQEREKAA